MKAGEVIQLRNNPHGQTHLIIMAVVDNYVMCRYPRCMPFCLPVKNFEQKFLTRPADYAGSLHAKTSVAEALLPQPS